MQDGQFETLCQGWLDEVEQLVDVVASMTNTQATKFHAELKEKLQIDEGQIQQLDATGTQLANQLTSTKTGNQRLQEELQQLHQESQKLSAKLQELQNTYQHDQEEAEELLPTHQALQTAVEEEGAASRRELASLERAVQQFRDGLGLRFVSKRGAPELRLEFSQLDPQQPEACSVLGINILPECQFAVTRCEPPVAALPELLAGLNAGGDFGQFVCAVRAHFLQLACAGHPQRQPALRQ